MTYPSKAVANFLLDLARIDGQPVTPMMVQKLVYFAHGWNLGVKGGPLLDTHVEAWQYGPVIPVLYREFREFADAPITRPALDGEEPWLAMPAIPNGQDHDWVRELASWVWKRYRGYSALQLSTMTHAPGTPWEQTVRPYLPEGCIPHGLEIPDRLIREYFHDRVATGAA